MGSQSINSWFSILKVSGKSMLPEFKNGDFVVITRFPLLFHNLSIADSIIFSHPIYGLLIKYIDDILPNGDVFVKGSSPDSLDSKKLGIIPFESIKGKVLFHFHRKK